jgi:polyisoprenoid-binding protein YceI
MATNPVMEPAAKLPEPATRYRFEPAQSRFTVQAFAGGLLSFLGHSPRFTVRGFAGSVEFPDDEIDRMRLELSIPSGGLAMDDAAEAEHRLEIESRMKAEVLEAAAFPEIEYQAGATKSQRLGNPGRYRVMLVGSLSLRGVGRPHGLEVELAVYSDQLRLRGETSLRMSDYSIAPISTLGGMIRIQDEVKLAFDLAARPEPL